MNKVNGRDLNSTLASVARRQFCANDTVSKMGPLCVRVGGISAKATATFFYGSVILTDICSRVETIL